MSGLMDSGAEKLVAATMSLSYAQQGILDFRRSHCQCCDTRCSTRAKAERWEEKFEH